MVRIYGEFKIIDGVETVINRAGVRFKAKPVVDTEKQKHALDEYFNNLAKEQRERLCAPVEEIELSDVAIDRLIEDLVPSFGFSNDLRYSMDKSKNIIKDRLKCGFNYEKAKAHAKEVAQAEKVEKYKRELLNSREARFYARFRELGATHEEAAKLAWGES